MKDLFELLPNIILYLASGYIFLVVFKFASWKTDEIDVDGKLSLSIVCGFLLKNLLCLIPLRFSETINIMGLLAFSVLIGILIGLLLRSGAFNCLLNKFVHRTIEMNIWHELVDTQKFMWIHAYDKETKRNIIGIAISIEENQRFPLIELQQYRIYDDDDNCIEDYSDDATKHMLLNTENYEVTIAYDKDSSHVNKYIISE